jgi:hypothetical protein
MGGGLAATPASQFNERADVMLRYSEASGFFGIAARFFASLRMTIQHRHTALRNGGLKPALRQMNFAKSLALYALWTFLAAATIVSCVTAAHYLTDVTSYAGHSAK